MAKSMQEREDTRQFRELRREIIQLRKENAQLRKRVHQLDQSWYESDPFDESDAESSKVILKKLDKKPCPKCGSYSIIEFRVMDRPYYKCDDCLSKGPFKE